MTPSQKLRSIADSTGLDGIADAIREIANEIEHNNAPAVPQGLQWSTVAERGIPEIGAEVIGGFWYTDPWLKPEFATTFMWGQCRVVEGKPRDFKDGKRWHTFGPSHNQITHWARINKPGEATTPAPAPAQEVVLTEAQTAHVRAALQHAWQLGQVYWQQADSNYTSEHKKSDETQRDFEKFCDDTLAALRAKGGK